MKPRQLALQVLYAIAAVLFAAAGALALGWWGALLGLVLFGAIVKLPYYSDWK